MTQWQDTDTDDEVDDVDELRPGDPDYDLSEAHGYTWEQDRTDDVPIPRWVLFAISVLVVVGLVLPSLFLVWRYG